MITRLFHRYEQAARLARRHARLVTILSLLIFAVTVTVAIAHLPIKLTSISPVPMLFVIAFLIPFTLCTNTLRIAVASRALGTYSGMRAAMRGALLSSAANLLPLPGAAIVRVGHIAGGDALKLGRAITLTVGSLLLSLSIGLGGLALSVPHFSYWKGAAFLAPPLAAIMILITIAWIAQRTNIRVAVQLALIEMTTIAIEAAKLWASLLALHISIPATSAVALSLNAVLGSLFALAPGGLGVREVIGASIAAVIELSAAGTVIAIAINRVLDMIFMGTTLGLTGMRRTSR